MYAGSSILIMMYSTDMWPHLRRHETGVTRNDTWQKTSAAFNLMKSHSGYMQCGEFLKCFFRSKIHLHV